MNETAGTPSAAELAVALDAAVAAVGNVLDLLAAGGPDRVGSSDGASDRGGWNLTDLVTVIDEMRRVVNRAAAVQAVAVAKVVDLERADQEARVGHPISGLRSDADARVRESDARAGAAAVVASALGMSAAWARDRVEHAVRLHRAAGPVLAAQQAGELDGYRAAIILDELAAAPDDVTAQVAALLVPDLLTDLVKNPGGNTAGRLRARVRRVIAQVDPDSVRERAARAREERSLRRWVAEPGVDGWEGTFRAEDSATAWTVIDTLAARYVREGRNTSIGQARADALLDLVHARATITPSVTVTLPALMEPTTAAAPAKTTAPTKGGPPTGDPTTKGDPNSDDGAAAAGDGAMPTATSSIAAMPSSAMPSTAMPSTAMPSTAMPSSAMPTATVAGMPMESALAGTTTAMPTTAMPVVAPSQGNGTNVGRDSGRSVGSTGGTDSMGPQAPTGTSALGAAHQTAGASSDRSAREGCSSPMSWAQITEHARGVAAALAALAGLTASAAPDAPDAPAASAAQASSAMDGVPVGGFGPTPVVVPPMWLAYRLATAVEARRVRVRWAHPVTGAWIDPDGELDTPGYRPSARLVAFVTGRDGGCRFPGCTISTRYVDLDHVIPFPTGPTTAGNLIALCRRHHRIKHRPGWAVTLRDDGSVEWVDPTGRHLTTQPVDHRNPVTPSDTPARFSTAVVAGPAIVAGTAIVAVNAGPAGDTDGFSRCEHHLEHLVTGIRHAIGDSSRNAGRPAEPTPHAGATACRSERRRPRAAPAGLGRHIRCEFSDGTIVTPDGRRHRLQLVAARPTWGRAEPKPGDPPPF